MLNTKLNGYFRPGITTLERLERERERIAGCADRAAAHYSEILREMDDEITAMKAKEESKQNG